MLKDRDKAILQKIGDYCQQIEQTVARFGADFETYCADHVYRNACCMCILQIGELVRMALDGVPAKHEFTVEDIIMTDRAAREFVRNHVCC